MKMDYTKRTSTVDLYRLAKHLGIPSICVCRVNELRSNLDRYDNFILNLDRYSRGTHWVYYNKPKNMYFDSYAQDKPTEIPKNAKLASTHKELQSIDATDCGGLCCLFAYYLNFKTKKEFYSLFKDVY
jgi:hypothetical protein